MTAFWGGVLVGLHFLGWAAGLVAGISFPIVGIIVLAALLANRKGGDMGAS